MLQSCLITAITPEELASTLLNRLLPYFQKLSSDIILQKQSAEELFTKQQAAKFIQVSLPTLNKLIKDGKIPCFRIGNTTRLKKGDIINSLTEIRNSKYSRRITENSS